MGGVGEEIVIRVYCVREENLFSVYGEISSDDYRKMKWENIYSK